MAILIFLAYCNNCPKLSLGKEEKEWVNHYKVGEKFLFKNSGEQIDTLEVTEVRNFYSPCNKFELSNYQFQVYDVSFALRSRHSYENIKVLFVLKAATVAPAIPYIYFGNIGPFKNDIKNRMPKSTDTLLYGREFSDVYIYNLGVNAENYGKKKEFKSFLWSKQRGLIAYLTDSNNLFTRLDN
jgi:hypothetical protein